MNKRIVAGAAMAALCVMASSAFAAPMTADDAFKSVYGGNPPGGNNAVELYDQSADAANRQTGGYGSTTINDTSNTTIGTLNSKTTYKGPVYDSGGTNINQQVNDDAMVTAEGGANVTLTQKTSQSEASSTAQSAKSAVLNDTGNVSGVNP